MKKAHLVIAVLLCLIICTACVAELTQPPQENNTANQQLEEAIGFPMESGEPDFPELMEVDFPVLDESPISIPWDAVSFKDDAAMELFTDEGLWAMPDMLQAEVYLLRGEMNIDFWFDEAATDHQINNARGFAIDAFVLHHTTMIGVAPYGFLVSSRDIEWQTASCRVYRGQELLYHERYDENKQLIKP